MPWGHILSAHIKVARFRGDIFCVCPPISSVLWIDCVEWVASAMYGMNLTVEQVGQ